jgi:hypothetical protein
MFTPEEVKEFFVKLGKKWFFPDFTNKLTWFVASIGGVILITPTVFKQIFYNWLVDTININSGVHFTLADLQTNCDDYIWGFGLILLSLAHNIANKYFIYKAALLDQKKADSLIESDKILFQQFLKEFHLIQALQTCFKMIFISHFIILVCNH